MTSRQKLNKVLRKLSWLCWLEKRKHDMKVVSCLTWGKKRTIAWETKSQITLRYWFQRGKKRSQYYILVKGAYLFTEAHIFTEACCQSCGTLFPINNFSDFLDMRCNNWTQNLLNYQKTCSASFLQSTEYLILILHPKLLLGGIES